ncbi:MAG TPA: DUF5667 domain-containing protein, partial [Anaerolineae bacterium]|nr:DUF5667 domain-containing protein [Anaerolineae bacterium]
MRRHRNFIIIGAVSLSLCVMGLSLVAAAQASLPGDRIYAVKLGLERLRLNLAPDDVTRARLDLAFLATRLDELQQVRETDSALIALDEVSAALAEATRAVVALPDAAQGDMRAELARLALRVVDVLTDWKTAGGRDPRIDRVIVMARALAEAAANPNVSAAELLLALDLAPATRASSPVAIAARTVSLPPELMASHRPPFSGRHAEISCSACHVGGKTAGMSAACTACHADPHEGRFEKLGFDCTTCHTDVDFKPSTFDHANFPDCQTCHLVDTPVNHFPGQCSNCHATQVWKPANFNHSGFTDCVSCHTQQAPPKHFPGQCSNCHNTSAWKPANFDHAGFTSCASCHTPPGNHFPGQCSD